MKDCEGPLCITCPLVTQCESVLLEAGRSRGVSRDLVPSVCYRPPESSGLLALMVDLMVGGGTVGT